MSDIIPANLSVPAHLANRIGKPSALNTSLVGGIGSGDFGPRISIKGSRFRIIDNGVETILPTLELEVVVVGANPNLSKTFYIKKYDPNDEPEGPDCFSLDGVKPHPDVEAPQNDLCATCRHNAWGSKIGDAGQKLKSCTDTKRLAVVPSNNIDGPVYLLGVTPSAFKGLNQFQKELNHRGIALEVVKTKIGFDPQASHPKLTFGFGGFLDADTQDKVDKLLGTVDVQKVTGELQTVAPVAIPEKPKPMLVKETKTAPAPEPVSPEEAAVHDSWVTTKKEAASAPKPAPEPKVVEENADLASEIADLLAGMDDDGNA